MSKVLKQLYFKLFYKELNSLDCYYDVYEKINYKYDFIDNKFVIRKEVETLINKLTFLMIEKRIEKRLLKIIDRL